MCSLLLMLQRQLLQLLGREGSGQQQVLELQLQEQEQLL